MQHLRPRLTGLSAACLLLLLTGCSGATSSPHSNASQRSDHSEKDDSFFDALGGGKSDSTYDIAPGSQKARDLLDFVNSASFETLDDDVSLDRRAARNIVEARKDGDIASLQELDAIPWVSSRAFGKLYRYAEQHGIFDSTSNAQSLHGVELGSPTADGILQLVNRASVAKLDLDVGLDVRAAEAIEQTRRNGRITDLRQLDAVSRVSATAFQKLRTHAADHGFVETGNGTVHGVTPRSPEANGIRSVAMTAGEKVLDDDVGLDARAAEGIVQARRQGEIDGIEALDAVPYLNGPGFQKLLTYASANGAVGRNCAPLSYERVGADIHRSALAVEPNGDAHLVFNAAKDAGHLLHYAHRPAGGSWSIRDIAHGFTTEAGNDLRPQDGRWELDLAVDAYGGLHAAFWADQPSNFYASALQLRYAYKPAGGSWQFDGIDGTYLRRNEGDAATGKRIELDVHTTEQGPRVHVISARSCYDCTDAATTEHTSLQYHVRTTDGTWERARVPNSKWAYNPAVAVDSDGIAHITYRDSRDIQYRTANPSGGDANWGRHEVAVPDADGKPIRETALALGPDGAPELVLTRGDGYYHFRRTADGKWLKEPYTSVYDARQKNLDFGIDATGRPHLLSTLRKQDWNDEYPERDLWYDVALGAPERETIPKHDTYRRWDWPELEVLPDGTSYFVASNNSPAGMLFWRRCSP